MSITKSIQNPIGVITGSTTVYCTICCCSRQRKLKAFVYQDTEEGLAEARKVYDAKAAKEYTCRICKSIKKEVAG